MKYAIKHIHFIGIGGSGMSAIAEVLLGLGYTISGSDISASATLQRLGSLGITGVRGPRRRPCRRRRRGRHDHRRARGQPRGDGSARAPDPGGAACHHAGRTDAPQTRHRDRRNPWQDHHHQSGSQRAGRSRHGPHLRHRRAAQQCRRQRAAGQGRLHRGRSRRVGRLVPEPAAGDGDRDQHRRRPHADLRPRLRATEDRVCRLPAPHAVLRHRHPVHRRRPGARNPAPCILPGHQLRFRRRRTGTGSRRAGHRRPDALHGAPAQRHCSAGSAGGAEPAGSAQRAQRLVGHRRGGRTQHPGRRGTTGTGAFPGCRSPLPALWRGAGRSWRPVHPGRRLWPPSGRDGSDDRSRPRRFPRSASDAGVPAAPLHPHARLLRRLRQGHWPGRRRAAVRRLSGRRDTHCCRGRPCTGARPARGRADRTGIRR